MNLVIHAASDIKAATQGTLAHQIILAYAPGNAYPWITWYRTVGSDKARFWGHYFASEQQARNDYLHRCSKAGLEPYPLPYTAPIPQH